MKARILFALCLIGGLVRVEGATYASDGTVADINALAAAASDGDIVTIPAGTTPANGASNRILIPKAITLQGAGVGQTFIEDDATTDTYILLGSVSNIRVTGITFRDAASPFVSSNWNNGVVKFGSTTINQRFDHCSTEASTNDGTGRRFFGIHGARGVADNCDFDSNRQLVFFRMNSDYGDPGWANDPPWGTADQWVFEDCTFGARCSVDGDGGSTVTVRFSDIVDSRFSFHGTESSQRYRGGRFFLAYNLAISTPTRTDIEELLDLRSGSGFVFNCDFGTADIDRRIKLNNYRSYHNFLPWGVSDGLNGWDYPDLTDGAGTPGGAGDGVFDSGTLTGGGTNTATDSGKSWTTNQWARYVLRYIWYAGTVGTGGTNTLTVSPSPGWTTNQWQGYAFRHPASGKVGAVSSNTANTVTVGSGDWPDITFSVGQAFQIFQASEIASNTATTLTIRAGFGGLNYTPSSGLAYEIRKVISALDQNGKGTGTDMTSSATPYDLGEETGGTPSAEWGNTGSVSLAYSVGAGPIVKDRDYYEESDGGVTVGTAAEMAGTTAEDGKFFWVTDQGEWNSTNGATPDGRLYRDVGGTWTLVYTPIQYPHPLRGESGGSDTTDPTISITSPTSSATHDNGATATIDLGGTASDNVEVLSVTWVNSRGGSGAASGTTTWSISSIPLQSGNDNAITVTVTDTALNTATDVITVTHTPAATPPDVEATTANVQVITVGAP